MRGNAKQLPPADDVTSEKLWIVLRRAYQSVADLLESGVTARGLGVSDFIVLEVLLHNGESNAKDIARKTRLSKASIDITLTRLEEQLLLERRKGGRQPARPIFQLTTLGRGLIDRLYKEHSTDIGAIFNVLSSQERRGLHQCLRTVGQNAAERLSVPTVNHSGGLTSWQLQRAVDYIRLHSAGPITTEGIAASIDLSDSHFRRAFKIATGVTPHRWLLGVRVSAAQKLMKEGVISLSEIALVTGFGDQSHFSRTFQKIIGVSPRVWQRDHALQ